MKRKLAAEVIIRAWPERTLAMRKRMAIEEATEIIIEQLKDHIIADVVEHYPNLTIRLEVTIDEDDQRRVRRENDERPTVSDPTCTILQRG